MNIAGTTLFVTLKYNVYYETSNYLEQFTISTLALFRNNCITIFQILLIHHGNQVTTNTKWNSGTCEGECF